MSGHQFVVSDCNVCHQSGPKSTVSMSASTGVSGVFTDSCLGCHGRDEGSGLDGAGLRDQHRITGANTCAESSCHFGDTASPVGEDILPPYYDLDLAVVTLTDPCNPGGAGEDFAGDSAGLDNDGDGLYDELDVIDCPEPEAVLLQCAALVSLLVIARRRSGKRPTRRLRRLEGPSGESSSRGSAPPGGLAQSQQPDISTLQRTRHFYFGLTAENAA